MLRLWTVYKIASFDRRMRPLRLTQEVVLAQPKCGCWMLVICRLNVVDMLTCGSLKSGLNVVHMLKQSPQDSPRVLIRSYVAHAEYCRSDVGQCRSLYYTR